MQKKIMTSCLVGVGMLAVAGMGFAQDIPARPGAGVENTASAQRAMGEVTSIDAKAGKLAVKTADQELHLNVRASAAKKSLESIKIGDKVNVSYRDQGGMLVADAVSKAGGTGEGAGAPSRSKSPTGAQER